MHMKQWLEKLLARLWNRSAAKGRAPRLAVRALDLGLRIVDGDARGRVTVPQDRRAEALAVLGKTGTGKSSLLRYAAKQDIEAGRGFLYFDLHGDATDFIVRTIAEHERRVKRDLSSQLIVIDPSDPAACVGTNPLEGGSGHGRFLQVAEFTEILKKRWNLDSLGARTDELLRNGLYALAENRLTLLELGLFLTHAAFRARCLASVGNAEVRQYFELRYDQLSEPMRAVMREPILNKISAFTADDRFRHIVGQERSTFSLRDAMDRAFWVVVYLHKGRLGELASTFGSLLLTVVKNAFFSRETRELFTIYADEIQNLVAYGSGLETILSEARKFAVSIFSANQFLDQYPADMRSAILAVGTHVLFQLSSADASQMATALDGGKPLAELLKNLPQRHMVVKTGAERWQEGIVPTIDQPKADPADLLARSRARWARARSVVEEEITRRQAAAAKSVKETLDGWQ